MPDYLATPLCPTVLVLCPCSVRFFRVRFCLCALLSLNSSATGVFCRLRFCHCSLLSLCPSCLFSHVLSRQSCIVGALLLRNLLSRYSCKYHPMNNFALDCKAVHVRGLSIASANKTERFVQVRCTLPEMHRDVAGVVFRFSSHIA